MLLAYFGYPLLFYQLFLHYSLGKKPKGRDEKRIFNSIADLEFSDIF